MNSNKQEYELSVDKFKSSHKLEQSDRKNFVYDEQKYLTGQTGSDSL